MKLKLARPRGTVKCICFLASTALVTSMLAAGLSVRAHPLDPARGYVVPVDQLRNLGAPSLNNLLHHRDFIFLSTVVFLATPTGSNQTYTSDATWNNSSNTVECVGAGGSGGLSRQANNQATGAGGGAYSKITNFSFATPGTTTATWQTGVGGTAQTKNTNGQVAGIDGGSTWFNNATDPGNGADNSKCSAQGGIHGVGALSGTSLGGAGGATTSSWGTTKNAGGAGGTAGVSISNSSGGGGAGGAGGAGNAGVNNSTALSASNGGAGNAGSGGGGTAGAGAFGTGQTAGSGGAGSNFDATHGSGGGGGGAGENSSGTGTSGAGGAYGGGSGGAIAPSGSGAAATQAGGDGLIVLTWTPAAGSTVGRGLTESVLIGKRALVN